MRKIRDLAVSRLRELFWYEPETGIVYRKTTRFAGLPAGTLFNTGHLQVSVDGKMTGVHRIAWALHHGEYPTVEIDHINGIGSDNRACNLRKATSSQNNQNRRISRRNKSGIKGVFRVRGTWRVSVGVNGTYHMAHFQDFDLAAVYADELRCKLHGEFARAA